ncbi:uncharacterized protein BDR25DRAFT_361322 [Lindgomyces ingoldianus]|uniref:Uncharacterized protein n=1 Tax=Lindgomyces ingoldianus TaxID=673940 RepID=A0ACB6QCY5_9PLEO|nr:uncharacterized protein BDR25DRAFT_361322 [Lindgomyces ingoldianus]KAF2464784.1 hypothetical protein BDR25DRAFT_361322 [Lindgomyces ingoldianus]
MRWESTQRHMGVRGDSEPGNAIDTYRPCTKGYQKTTKLATGARSRSGLIRGPSGELSQGRSRYGDPSDRFRAT